MVIKESNLGSHQLIDIFFKEYPKELNKIAFLKSKIEKIISKSDLSVISSEFHKFKPQGSTGFYILSESHISFHTWPEERYIAIDIFTCGDKYKAQKATLEVKNQFSSYKIEKFIVKKIKRGFMYKV